MTAKAKEAFERWWKRYQEGCPLQDVFELGVVRSHAEAAFESGIRFSRKTK